MKKKRILSLLLALAACVSLAAPAYAESTTAAVIRLTKTEGTVNVSKSSGKNVSLRSKLRLYKGYHVATEKKSYAWINLDDAKLIKEDASSEVEVRKSGKKLEVNLSSGNIFFDVSEKLDDDESLNISTSTMVVGVRGTSGWIEIEDRWKSRLYVLEGSVQCYAADPVTGQLKVETVKGGEMVECVVYPQDRIGDKCDILRRSYKADDIPGYVLADLVRDVPLCDKILRETGMDVLRALAKTGGGRTDGGSATQEVIRAADERLKRDETQADKRLNEINATLRKQDSNVSTDGVWDKGTTSPGTTTPGSGSGSGSGSGGSRPSTPVDHTHTITFSLGGDGATWPDGSTGSIVMVTNSSGRLASLPPVPVREGYTFVGWRAVTRARAAQNTVSLLDYSFTSDTQMEPVWQENNPTGRFTVTFDANGGTVSPATAQTSENGTVTLPTPVREGYTFDGWFTAVTGGTAVTAATEFTRNTTVYARWTEAPTGGVQWEYIAATKTLHIWGAGPMDDYEILNDVRPPWTAYINDIEAVVIDNGITSIGNDAFYNCVNLSNVSIPDSVTSIGHTSFLACYGLTEVRIPGSVTSLNSYAFMYCDYMTDIYYGGPRAQWNALNYRNTDGITVHCTDDGGSETGVRWEYNEATRTLRIWGNGAMEDIEGYDGTSSSRIPWYPYHASISNITIEAGVTSIGALAFESCRSMTNITIPTTVTSIGEAAFMNCFALTSVTIPSSVTSIGPEVFVACNSLTSINVSTANPNYSSTSGILFNKNRTELICYPAGKSGAYTIPGTVIRIGDNAFEFCTDLTGITIPNSVTSIGNNAFNNCTGLTSVTIPSNVTSIGDAAFLGCAFMADVTIPNTVTRIGDQAFDYCGSLADIYFGGTRAQWNALNCNSVPDGCTVHCTDDGDTPTGGVTWRIDGSTLYIEGSGAMEDIEGYNGTGTWPWSNSNEAAIQTIIIGNGVTSIGQSAFRSFTNLTSVTVPDSVTSIGTVAFVNCSSLTDIVIPNAAQLGRAIFQNCSGLRHVSITGSAVSIGQSLFYGCGALETVTLPDTLTSINQAAFYECGSLTSVTIPESVASIESAAFERCTSLTSLTIPVSVTRIGNYVFDGCTGLTDVYYNGTQAEWNAITIGDYNAPLTGANIHYNSTP